MKIRSRVVHGTEQEAAGTAGAAGVARAAGPTPNLASSFPCQSVFCTRRGCDEEGGGRGAPGLAPRPPCVPPSEGRPRAPARRQGGPVTGPRPTGTRWAGGEAPRPAVPPRGTGRSGAGARAGGSASPPRMCVGGTQDKGVRARAHPRLPRSELPGRLLHRPGLPSGMVGAGGASGRGDPTRGGRGPKKRVVPRQQRGGAALVTPGAVGVGGPGAATPGLSRGDGRKPRTRPTMLTLVGGASAEGMWGGRPRGNWGGGRGWHERRKKRGVQQHAGRGSLKSTAAPGGAAGVEGRLVTRVRRPRCPPPGMGGSARECACA